MPWSDAQLKPESSVIQAHLVKLNTLGFLTINSQPAVDGVSSSNPHFGWGPKDGWVYQKAYLEFFVAPTRLDSLVAEMDKSSMLTYYAVNAKVGEVAVCWPVSGLSEPFSSQGDFRTNSQSNSATALTWGVFPGSELKQPIMLVSLNDMGRGKPRDEVERGLIADMETVNTTLEAHEAIGKIVVVNDIWTIDNNLMTPTMKVKRNEIEKRYGSLIAAEGEKRNKVSWES